MQQDSIDKVALPTHKYSSNKLRFYSIMIVLDVCIVTKRTASFIKNPEQQIQDGFCGLLSRAKVA